MIALRQRGVEPAVQLFPKGEFKPRELDDRPVAQVSWAAVAGAVTGAAPALKDALFGQLLLRHTAKIDYDTARAVAPGVLDQLRAAVVNPAVRFGGTVEAQALAPLRAICWESAKVELLTLRTIMESLKLTRVGPAEIAQHRDGISVNSMVPRIASALAHSTAATRLLKAAPPTNK